MSDKRIFHGTSCLITGLAVSTVPIACYFLRPNLSHMAKYFQVQDLVAHPESASLDENVRQSEKVANSKYNSTSLSSTIKSDGSYRISTSVSFAAMDEAVGLFASLSPRSSMAVFTRENMSNNDYETPYVELHVPPEEKPVPLCEEEAVTGRLRFSNVRFSVCDEESEANACESFEGDMRPSHTYSRDTKAMNIMTARSVMLLHVSAAYIQEASPIHHFHSLMTAHRSREQLREPHVIKISGFKSFSSWFRPCRFNGLGNNSDTMMDCYIVAGSTLAVTEPSTKKFLLHTVLLTLFFPWILTMSEAIISKTYTHKLIDTAKKTFGVRQQNLLK